MNYKLLGGLTAASLSLSLVACGDENTTEVTKTTGLEMVAVGDSIPECSQDIDGQMVYVADSAKVYYCADGKWSGLNGADGADGKNGADGEDGADGASCTAELLSDSTGYNVICDGDIVGTILNGTNGVDGKDGADGENGSDGADGASCTAELLSDSSGYNVICDGDTVGTILNGDKGDKGDKGTSCTAEALEDGSGYNVVCGGDTVGTILNGTDGASCTLNDEGNGSVTVTCGEGENAVSTTLYKAMCGTAPYDPAEGFCYADSVYRYCDGSSYDPSKGFCYEDSVYSCDGAPYDPSKGFCYADSLYNFCDGSSYDPSSHVCYADSLYNFCDGSSYNPSTHFCYEDSLYSCGGAPYDPSSQFCDTRDNQIYKYVTIGTQTWMGSNLNYETENSYSYDDDPSNCSKYGRLYTWAAAMDSVGTWTTNGKGCGYNKTCSPTYPVRGVCPSGWHLPDTTEWNTLFSAVGGKDVAGTALKSTSGWNEYEGKSGNGSDAFGFSALPAGIRSSLGNYYDEGTDADFWSSTECDGINACHMYLYFSYGRAGLYYYSKLDGFSVRCLKD